MDQNLFKNGNCPWLPALWLHHQGQGLQLGKRLVIGTSCQTACVTGRENGTWHQNHCSASPTAAAEAAAVEASTSPI